MIKYIYNQMFYLQECGDFTWREPDCEELVVKASHTIECVNDLFIFWDILFTTQSYELYH